MKVGPLRRDLFDRYGMFETCSIAKMQVRKGEIFKNRYGGRDYSKRHRWSGSRKWTGSFHIYIYITLIVHGAAYCVCPRNMYPKIHLFKNSVTFESTLWYAHFFLQISLQKWPTWPWVDMICPPPKLIVRRSNWPAICGSIVSLIAMAQFRPTTTS